MKSGIVIVKELSITRGVYDWRHVYDSSQVYIVHKIVARSRVCHELRLLNRDDYFLVAFDYFWIECHFLAAGFSLKPNHHNQICETLCMKRFKNTWRHLWTPPTKKIYLLEAYPWSDWWPRKQILLECHFEQNLWTKTQGLPEKLALHGLGQFFQFPPKF